MAIKNYTSTVKPTKTINEIENILLEHGIRQIHKNFDSEGKVSGIYFTIPFNDRMVHYKMPAKIDEVRKILKNQKEDTSEPVATTHVKNAECVAWRIIKDWIDSQLAMVAVNLVDIHQIFLPYAVDPATDETLYDKFVQGNMPSLLTD